MGRTIEEINKMATDAGLPPIGSKAFNDLCERYFGGGNPETETNEGIATIEEVDGDFCIYDKTGHLVEDGFPDYENAKIYASENGYEVVETNNTETAGTQPEPTQIEKDFYMNICRAYNAGKDNMVRTINGAKFIDSHTYFTGEFPEFKTNVP